MKILEQFWMQRYLCPAGRDRSIVEATLKNEDVGVSVLIANKAERKKENPNLSLLDSFPSFGLEMSPSRSTKHQLWKQVSFRYIYEALTANPK